MFSEDETPDSVEYYGDLSRPRTVQEYLLKYYGRDRFKSYSDGEAGYDSDVDTSTR